MKFLCMFHLLILTGCISGLSLTFFVVGGFLVVNTWGLVIINLSCLDWLMSQTKASVYVNSGENSL